MPARFLFLPIVFCALTSYSQFKNDNVKYKTIFIEDLCESLKTNPDYVLLDVRSKGEYSDTSSSNYLNIGHLKNAINIDINELGTRLNEIRNATNKPVFIYCSHSQRSRRASTMLADSGFAMVYNINGGLTTFNLLKETGIPCADLFYETGNKYNFLSPADMVTLLNKEKDVFILDIRQDSVFRGISRDELLNAYGKLNNAVNIALESLAGSLAMVPKDKKIIIVDEAGNEGPKAAKILFANGYKDVSLAFNGMSSWIATPLSELPEKNKYWNSPVAYKMITADDFDELAKKNKELVIVDVRSAEEFNNKAKDAWRNRGNIKNAINIPSDGFATRWKELDAYKLNHVVIHHFSSQREAFLAAKTLSDNGFTNVHVLIGGIWNLRWRAANIKGKSHLAEWVENIPPDNL